MHRKTRESEMIPSWSVNLWIWHSWYKRNLQIKVYLSNMFASVDISVVSFLYRKMTFVVFQGLVASGDKNKRLLTLLGTLKVMV